VPIRLHLWLLSALVLISGFAVCLANEDPPLAKRIQDNSFFVEEAYNQETGVVQHIFAVPLLFKSGQNEISPNFTQEWPVFSQLHQFSYTIPCTFQQSGEWENGFGDIRLNYRLQALMEGERIPAFAPRFTFVTPFGGEKFGNGVLGYETNLPFSKIIADRWTVHFNAGGSLYPGVHGHDLTNYNLGASAIYAVSANLNLMLETVANWDESVGNRNRLERTVAALISPGARYAFNLPNQAQLVVGAAVPIGVTSDSPDWGLFFYLSFEHPFTRTLD
jgi:hypothetical protein